MTYLLCVGMGYSARVVSGRLASQGWTIVGTARSASNAARLAAMGWHGLVFDGEHASTELSQVLQRATHLLISVAPMKSGDPLLRQHAEDIARAPNLTSMVYLSTIGVYGDHGGNWIDETAPCRARSERGTLRVAAEQAWQHLAVAGNKRLAILRLSGIYGPGRNTFENLLAGEARRIIKPGQVFNRIHVDDIATAAIAAFGDVRFAGAINVTDNEPAPPQDVIAHAAALLGLPVPPEISFDEAEMTPMARSFYSDNKRVANRLLCQELGVRLDYPDYRVGLAGLLPGIRAQRAMSGQ